MWPSCPPPGRCWWSVRCRSSAAPAARPGCWRWSKRPGERVNVAQLVGRTLARLGVGHAFGVVGSGNFAVTAALRAAGVSYVAARHEGGAATMADAFARMSGQVAVLSTHQGCGYTNALTGIAEAAKSRTPLLVLAHAAPVHGGTVHGGAVHGGAVHGGAVHGGAVHGGAVHEPVLEPVPG